MSPYNPFGRYKYQDIRQALVMQGVDDACSYAKEYQNGKEQAQFHAVATPIGLVASATVYALSGDWYTAIPLALTAASAFRLGQGFTSMHSAIQVSGGAGSVQSARHIRLGA